MRRRVETCRSQISDAAHPGPRGSPHDACPRAQRHARNHGSFLTMQSFSRLQKPVLVLNASYEPINVCAARRALVLVLKGVASAEEVTSHAVHSTRRTVELP